jgi:hypothetical protein
MKDERWELEDKKSGVKKWIGSPGFPTEEAKAKKAKHGSI